MPFIHHIGGRCFASIIIALAPAIALIGCSTAPQSTPGRSANGKSSSAQLPALPRAGSGRGGYYRDDGPGDNPPDGLLDMEDPEPKVEPYSSTGNRPYVVFGKTYVPITDQRPFVQRGTGSWYGKKFHGQKTSSGELYDMYKMTAAHPTLPIPSYARVTNLANGKQVIVRVNDRGPFHASRIIDLSYVAALKLGYLANGSGKLQVERLLPDEIARIVANKRNGTAAANSASASSAVASGVYLQIGVYSQASNAEAARTSLLKSGATDLPPMDLVEQGQSYRLYTGPFPSREEAMLAAQRIQQLSSSKPMLVQR